MIPWLALDSYDFPDTQNALTDPNGLLAVGGDLCPERLVSAYRAGIFPWFSEDQPILWWSPDPRCMLYPNEVHISRSLKKHMRKQAFRLSFDEAFDQVMAHCARIASEEGSWITEDMYIAYQALHRQGIAHSVEVWYDDALVGGLYGLAIGRCFFGESMFSLQANTSKIAFAALCRQLERWRYAIIDCQVENNHLLSLGAHTIPRTEFITILKQNIDQMPHHTHWQFDEDIFSTL